MDNVISPDEVITETNEVVAPETNVSPSLQQAMWGDPVEQVKEPVQNGTEPVTQPIVTEPATKVEDETETFDEIEYLKRNFEVESIDAIKAEREELKRLREQKQEEIKFENDESKNVFELLKSGKIDEVLEVYNTKKKIEKALATEINKDTAADIIKMGMQLKYKDLSPSEIEYKYNKEFGIPKEPKQAADELDEDFAARKSEWEEKVRDVEMNKIIEAKLLRPELESSNSKITFPELGQANNAAPKPTQEDLDNFKRQQESFVQSANATLNEFKGFTTQVKDKDVDYNVSYAPSKEEKESVGKIMQKFASEGFNANALLAEFWVKEDGTLDVNRIAEDLLRITTGRKSDAKIANDAAGQRMEQYLKDKKNINLKDVRNDVANPNLDNKTPSERLQEQFWGSN